MHELTKTISNEFTWHRVLKIEDEYYVYLNNAIVAGKIK